MRRFVFSYHRVISDGEVRFLFPSLPEIFSATPLERLKKLSPDQIDEHVADAVLTSLQTRIAARLPAPTGDGATAGRAEGFVALTVQQAMKLELYRACRERKLTYSELSRMLGKNITAVRRMFDLRHPSVVTEIEGALAGLGLRLVHAWDVEPDLPPGHVARRRLALS